jgi:hypothetical protein
MVKLLYTIELLIMSLDNNQQLNNINIEDNKEFNEKTKKIKTMGTDIMYIGELIDKVDNIIKSPNKNDFIKNYNECHNQIKKVDEILYSNSTIDTNNDIKVLFEMLKEYEALIENGDISVSTYKNMRDLIELIENKMKNLSIDIKEIQ